jgi:hypothetical protein
MKLIKKHTIVCNCKKKLTLREYKEDLAVGGKCVELAWNRGAFTSSDSLHSFLCPKCGNSVIWKPMIDNVTTMHLPDGLVLMMTNVVRKKLRGARQCTKRS